MKQGCDLHGGGKLVGDDGREDIAAFEGQLCDCGTCRKCFGRAQGSPALGKEGTIETTAADHTMEGQDSGGDPAISSLRSDVEAVATSSFSDDPQGRDPDDGNGEMSAEGHDDEGWDYLGDGYYTEEERDQMRAIVEEERREMLEEAESSKLGTLRWHRSAQLLGSGTFGCVYQAMDDETGEILAVKEVVAAAGKTRAINALRLELETLRQLRHPNIVRYRGMLICEEKLCVAMEFCPGGSLSSILAKFGVLDDIVVRRYTTQILSGLEYLHRHCIVHRDIKCPNCLLGTDGIVKLADFGASKRLHALCTSSLQGTAQYIAPEILRREKIGRQSDIWSVGCCVLEMYTLSLPFAGQFSNDFALMYTMANMKEPPPVPTHIPEDAQSFIRDCFMLDPSQRPSAHRLRKHPFLLNFVDDQEHANTVQPANSATADSAESRVQHLPGTLDRDKSIGANSVASALVSSEQDVGSLPKAGSLDRQGVSASGTNDRTTVTSGASVLQGGNSHSSSGGSDDFVPTNRRSRYEPELDRSWEDDDKDEEPFRESFGLTRRSWSTGSRDDGHLYHRDGQIVNQLDSNGSDVERSFRLRRNDSFLDHRFVDDSMENQYRQMWMDEAIHAVQFSWTWFMLVLALGLLDIHMSWSSSPMSTADAVKIVAWLVIYGIHLTMRFQLLPLSGGADAFVWIIWWIRLIEIFNLMLVCLQSAGDFVSVLRILMLTFSGGHFKLSILEHVLFVILFAGCRLVQLALMVILGTGAGTAVNATAAGLNIAQSIQGRAAGGLFGGGIVHRMEAATSSVMLQTVSAAASIFYAIRSHDEARSRFQLAASG